MGLNVRFFEEFQWAFMGFKKIRIIYSYNRWDLVGISWRLMGDLMGFHGTSMGFHGI
jgi:hypothetical protein